MSRPKKKQDSIAPHRSSAAVAVDLEAVIGNARVLISRYTHAIDFAYRGLTSSVIRLPEPGRGIADDGSVPGPTPGLAHDPRRQAARSHIDDANQSILNALAALRAAQRSLDRIYGKRADVQQEVQLRKGPYYVEALAAQKRRRERGEE
jgi:hypothetical protein